MAKEIKKVQKLIVMLGLSGLLAVNICACGREDKVKDEPNITEEDNLEGKDSPEEKVEEPVNEPEKPVKEEPMDEQEETGLSYGDLEDVEFNFNSGAGAWNTSLEVEADGSFSGLHNDSDMGDSGEGYPDGTRYISSFSGKFGKLEKVNEYTYSTTIESIQLEKEPGTEELADNVRYVYSEPYGIEGAEEILFYLKGAPISELPEGYLSWVRFSYGMEEESEELPFYGLYNVAAEAGFSGYED